MKKALHNYRKLYQKSELRKSEVSEDPMQLFNNWFAMAEAEEEKEVNAMTLSTIGQDGFPKGRIVLLKEYDAQGFVFYTNYTSEKGKSLLETPKASLSFFWPRLERQVLIKGTVEQTSREDSTSYFKSRPRGSQLGAWVSRQSTEVPSREFLEKSLKELELKYQNKPVPIPPFWGGFKVFPNQMEFWQGRPNRLHDRIRYQKNKDVTWKISRLAP